MISSDFLQKAKKTLRAAGSAAAILFLSSMNVAAQDKLSVMTYGGVFTDTERAAYYDPFTKATGIEVVPVAPPSLAKWKAAVTLKTYDVDVSQLAENDYFQALNQGLLEPLDYSFIDKSIGPSSMFEEHGIQAQTIAIQIAYNTNKFPNGGPKSWADFWDVKKFPGDRALWNSPVGNIEFALLADGMPRDMIYPLDEAKVDRALKKIAEIKPHIKIWWEQGGQSQQILNDGEVDLMGIWSPRANDLINHGAPVGQVWNEALIVVGRWAIPKGSPRKEAAMKFIASSIDPAKQAVFFKGPNFGSMNPAMLKHLSPAEAAGMPSSPEHLAQGLRLDGKWWGDNIGWVLPKWQAALLN